MSDHQDAVYEVAQTTESQIADDLREARLGVAFSGGGIRSAALASGVLRRILQKRLPVDCLSSVSGGGYVASAYMDWKARHGNKDDPVWHEQFFNNMRRNSGVLCHWRNPLLGLLDVLILFLLLFVVGVLIPLLLWIPIAFPLAYFTDYLFGDMMRVGFQCPGHIHFENETINILFTSYSRLLEISQSEQCTFNGTSEELRGLYFLFTISVLSFLVFFALTTVCFQTWRPRFAVFAYLSLLVLCLTFLPWFMEQFIPLTSTWVNVVLISLCVLLWLGVPQFRSRAAWGLLIFFYANVAKWRVYRTPVWIIPYIKFYFPFVLWMSGILFWFGPYLVMLQQGAIHAFYRWKLQRAFYTRQSAGRFGCRGITLADFWPMCTCDDRPDDDQMTTEENGCPNRPLTLSDLRGISPEYICSVLVDNWQYECSDTHHRLDTDYALLTLTPYVIERIDDEEMNDFHDLIGPQDIKLSDAMATSAAVVTYHMGKYKEESLLSLQVMLGMTMGKSWITDRTLLPKGNCLKVWLPFVIQCTLVVPLLVSPLWLVIPALPEVISDFFLGVFITILLVVIIVAVLPTGNERHGMERIVRWCIVNVRQVRFLREMLQITNVGSAPPAVLHLSDGGHVENLGLLPLLKRRLAKIIVVDGGYCMDDRSCADELMQSIDMARCKLRCSFRGINNRDIIEDIRDNLVEPQDSEKPRCYRFYVDYYEKSCQDRSSELVGTGEVLYLLPRHPDKGKPMSHVPWLEYFMDTGVKLKANRWGSGPVLEAYEVDKLTFACCELCHCRCWKFCSQPVCGRFPQHLTVNQFFTSQQFSAYHREGYRAAMEAGIEAFAAT